MDDKQTLNEMAGVIIVAAIAAVLMWFCIGLIAVIQGVLNLLGVV